jgi:hypothetical protein
MRILPHFIVIRPRVKRIVGHSGITILFWTFVDAIDARDGLHPMFVLHERRHVQQWVIFTLGAMFVLALLAFYDVLSWWWLLASPLGFIVPYFASFIPGGYSGSWFERDAERYADRRLNG